jgi:hypothetical protein
MVGSVIVVTLYINNIQVGIPYSITSRDSGDRWSRTESVVLGIGFKTQDNAFPRLSVESLSIVEQN